MRGKKADPVFVSEFIGEAIRRGIETPDEIVQDAKKKIAQIDEEIKAIEAKKILRSKLLDVVLAFEKQSKDKTEEAKLLPFFDLKYPDICKDICELLKYEAKTLPAFSWASSPMGPNAAEHNFAVKQMIEAKIIMKVGDRLMRDERFDDYCKFVLGQ